VVEKERTPLLKFKVVFSVTSMFSSPKESCNLDVLLWQAEVKKTSCYTKTKITEEKNEKQ
jgi:hypothetical protein